MIKVLRVLSIVALFGLVFGSMQPVSARHHHHMMMRHHHGIMHRQHHCHWVKHKHWSRHWHKWVWTSHRVCG